MKRNQIFSVLSLWSVVVLATACGSSFQQDPLAGQPNSVRDAAPADNKPPREAGPRVDRESLDIVLPGNEANFIEGKENTIVVSGAAFEAKENVQLIGWDVPNLDEFEGATVQAVEKSNPRAGIIFTWTPREDFVVGDTKVIKKLELVLVAKSNRGQFTRSESIQVNVWRQEKQPEIISVESLTNTPVREGTKRTFEIKVRDPDGLDRSGLRQTLRFLMLRDKQYGRVTDASRFVRLDSSIIAQDAADPSIYTYTAAIDLTDLHEITKNEEEFYFGVRATSRFGIPSDVFEVPVLIRTSVREPILSWKGPFKAVTGKFISFMFQVYDPSREGKVTAELEKPITEYLGPSSQAKCERDLLHDAVASCRISWSIPENLNQLKYQIPVIMKNQSPVYGDSITVEVRDFIEIEILQSDIPDRKALGSASDVGGNRDRR